MVVPSNLMRKRFERWDDLLLGVKGMTLDGDKDAVVGMVCVEQGDEETTILVVSENGNGKRSLISDYRLTNRGGKGVKTMNVTDKTGKVVCDQGREGNRSTDDHQ